MGLYHGHFIVFLAAYGIFSIMKDTILFTKNMYNRFKVGFETESEYTSESESESESEPENLDLDPDYKFQFKRKRI